MQNCSRSVKLVFLIIVISCYCFGGRGNVSVVCSIVLSKGIKPFMPDVSRAVTRHRPCLQGGSVALPPE